MGGRDTARQVTRPVDNAEHCGECGHAHWSNFPGDATLVTVMSTLPVVLRPGEDGWIVAECPVLPGCISQGKTREEALASISEAIALCLESGDKPSGELVDVTVAA